MKHQTDRQLNDWIHKYGCFFMVIVYWFYFLMTKIDRSYSEIIAIEGQAFERGIITGDINKDGDLDDAGEGEIQGDMMLDGKKTNGKDALAALAGMKLCYVGRVQVGAYVWLPGQFCIGEYHREWVENGKRRRFTHFVAVNGREIAGRKSDASVVTYDPIPKSNTVAYGKLVAVRVFEPA